MERTRSRFEPPPRQPLGEFGQPISWRMAEIVSRAGSGGVENVGGESGEVVSKVLDRIGNHEVGRGSI
ncbi:hypothetical protein ACIBG0_25600 [Nocardia sp. NPDC050630]|uniref:hypothetical protein n=1 Tax=Nocardia sp. NPDC050630 TaxID=3364321 RepID=UPI00378A93B2